MAEAIKMIYEYNKAREEEKESTKSSLAVTKSTKVTPKRGETKEYKKKRRYIQATKNEKGLNFSGIGCCLFEIYILNLTG